MAYTLSPERRAGLLKIAIGYPIGTAVVFAGLCALRGRLGWGLWFCVCFTGAIVCACAAYELAGELFRVRRERIAHERAERFTIRTRLV